MASNEPLISQGEAPTMKDQAKKCMRMCCYGIGAALLVVFVLAWVVQGVMFYWATSFSGCSASNLDGYSYPGGDESDAGGPSFNILPKISLLAERKPMWYGAAFDVIPSDQASTVSAAPVGTWWQTWGPLFPTYTYEDIANSRTTLYMRRKLLRIGQTHIIGRCDGKGPLVTFDEGSGWLVNRIRKMFGMNQGMTYKIWLDDELIGTAEETQHGFQSMTFIDKDTGEKMSTSVLIERTFHGQYDLWLVNSEKSSKLPYYVPSASTLLFAFFTLHEDARDVEAQHSHISGSGTGHDSPKFLAASVSNSSLPYVETVAESSLEQANVPGATVVNEVEAQEEAPKLEDKGKSMPV